MTEPVSDPRVRFYLERRDLIDEWIEAAQDESGEVERFLGRVADELEQLVSKWDDDTLVFRSRTQVGIYRSSWLGPDDVPRVYVGLGWQRGKVKFVGPEKVPWVGVRARLSGPHKHTRAVIQDALVVKAGLAGFDEPEDESSNWPVSTWLPCEFDDYWEDLTPYRQFLLEQVTSAWARVATLLDDAIRIAGELED